MSATPSNSITESFKRMLPVWAIMLVTVLGSLYMIRANAVRYLENGLYAQENAGDIAEVRYFAGLKVWRELASESEGSGTEDNLTGSLGEFKNDPRIKEARDHFQASIDAFELHPGNHQKLAQLAFWEGNQAEAFYQIAQEFLIQKRNSQAKANLNGALAFADDDERKKINIALGRIARVEENWEDLESIVLSDPEFADYSPNAKLLMAEYYYHTRQFDSAIESVTSVLEQNPGNSDAATLYMNIFATNTDADERLSWLLNNLDQADTVNAQIYHRLSRHFFENQLVEKSLEAIDRAIAVQPYNMQLILDKAVIVNELGREAEARRLLSQAISLDFRVFTDLIKNEYYQNLSELNPETVSQDVSP